MPLECSIRALSPDTSVVTLKGALSLGTGLKIADTQIQGAIEAGVRHMVLDLSEVPYMDSAGLGALIHTYGIARSSGGILRLAGVQERVLELLRITCTDLLMPMDSDVEASLTLLAQQPGA